MARYWLMKTEPSVVGIDDVLAMPRQTVDWWGVRNNTQIKEADFLRQVNQTYSHLAVRKQVELHGYIIEEERVTANGEIELLVSEPG